MRHATTSRAVCVCRRFYGFIGIESKRTCYDPARVRAHGTATGGPRDRLNGARWKRVFLRTHARYDAGMMPAVLFPLFLMLCVAVPVAPRHADAAQLTFELYAVGMPVAESTMTFDLAPASYGMQLRYHTTGLARVFTSDSLDQSSNGTFQRDEPVPLTFRSFVRLHSQDRIVSLAYHDGNPAVTAVSPPNEAEREIVPMARREHTLDPLSAMVEMLHAAAKTGRCDLSRQTYDGRRLELFEARTVGEEEVPPTSRSIFSGRGLRCDYSSRPIAGIRLGEGHDDDARARKGTIWLASVVSGEPRLPVRGLVDVRFLGAATMYLTAVAP